MPFAVAEIEALPRLFVVAVVELSVADAPLDGAANVTVSPETGFPPESVTVATRVAPNAVKAPVLCGVPLVAAMDAWTPVVFVSANVALFVPDVAVTLYVPSVAFAVAVTLAWPSEFVVALVALRVAEAPLPGAAKVTLTFGMP